MVKRLEQECLKINVESIQHFLRFYIKSKKGIFFTALLVLMSSTLLTLTILLFNTSLESEERFVELSSLDTTYNLYSSVENSIINILLYETGGRSYEFTNGADYLEFDWQPELNRTEIDTIIPLLESFKDFVESEYTFIGLNISDEDSHIIIDIDVNFPGMDVRKKRGLMID